MPLPSQSCLRPGPVSDATDERLAALRRRVVEPVVRSLLQPEELGALSVHWGVDGEAGDVWVRIDAAGERHEQQVARPWGSDQADPPDPPDSDPSGGPGREASPTEAEVAAQLAHYLEDWVCETSFAWGQQRRARYELGED